jgi:hypothetical protein
MKRPVESFLVPLDRRNVRCDLFLWVGVGGSPGPARASLRATKTDSLKKKKDFEQIARLTHLKWCRAKADFAVRLGLAERFCL